MKAWAAEGGGGENFDKRNVFHKRNVVESMGCKGEGENCDKRNVFDTRNVVVESMGCRGGGKILIKGSQVGSHKGKCVSAMLWAAEGGGKIVIKGMFLIKGML